MASTEVSQLVWLLDEAFSGENWHSLLNNVKAVDERDWSKIPEGGDRSVKDIVEHVGVCKMMYENHAFGDARLSWDDALIDGSGSLASIPTAIDWLCGCHERLKQSVAVLSDDELSRPRKTHVGSMKETRWLIAVMIEHDLYHSGEINLIRSLSGRETEWVRYL
jgi:hypothetical protein